MIIKTKSHKFMPHIKAVLVFIAVAILPFILGWIWGSAYTLNWVVDVGLRFVDFSSIIDESLVKQAVFQYKQSLGGWINDPVSPFYVNDTNQFMTPAPQMCLSP